MLIFFQILENGIRGGISLVFGDRFIEPDNNHKILFVEQNKLYGNAMSQSLPTDNFQIHENNSIRDCFIDKVLNTHEHSNIWYVLLVDLISPDNNKEKSKNFPFCPENKVIYPDKLTEYMKEHVPKPYKTTSKLICDQTNKECYIVHYRNLKLLCTYGYDY